MTMSNLVRLKYATTQEFAVGGIPGGVAYTYVKVKVKNTAPSKDVQVHYKQPSPSWADISLPWLANYGDYDLFGRSDGFVTSEFAVYASIAGEVDWDNNGWMNYRLENFQNVVGGNVALNKATAKQGVQAGGGFTFQTSWFEGEIYVNNLCFAKRVGVRFTADDWATWQDCDAVYAGPVGEGTYSTSSGAEVWKFKTPELNYDHSSNVFTFAVYFLRLDSGAWYWDNNFDQDYTLAKAADAFIE
jgi:hypothetical protein